MFWFHFYAATQRGTLSTEWARETAVNELELDTLDEDEAIHLLRLASKGVYDAEDMPGQWPDIFERMDRKSVPGADTDTCPPSIASGHDPFNRA